MATMALTKDNFAATLDDNEVVVIDFWASWCGPCVRFAPIYESVSEKHQDVVFAKVDTDANQELSAAMGIQSIPTVIAFRGSQEIYRGGPMNASQLDDLVSQVKNVDMDQLRAEAGQ